jgi:hypothetical protein
LDVVVKFVTELVLDVLVASLGVVEQIHGGANAETQLVLGDVVQGLAE